MLLTSLAKRMLAALTLAAVPASAAIITYSNKTDWENSVTDLVTLNYEGPAPGATVKYTTASGVPNAAPFQIVGYTDGTPSISGTQGTSSYWWLNWGTGAVLLAPENTDNTQNIVVTYTGGPTAIGLYLMTFSPQAADVNILVNGTAAYTVSTQPNPTPTWWGITGSEPITTARFQSVPLNSTLLIDYISAGTTAGASDPIGSVPEPSSLFLCGAGLLSLGFIRRRSA